MRARLILILFLILLFNGQIFAAGESGLQVETNKPGAVVKVEREIGDDKLLLSVSDAAKRPLFGLTSSDFVVNMGGRTARIISAQPASESLDVPRNIVLVLDNSYSMHEREAIGPLLAGVDELLKIIRPIDQVEIVVFSDKDRKNIGGRNLRVRTFKSNKPGELKNFVSEVYSSGITARTVLYEGMLAGIELIRAMPSNEPRFMVVFSDGEDLNSAYKESDVFKAMEGLTRFNAYAIDFMPGNAIDKFLTAFAERSQGEIWKATSETGLVPIFQSVASKMQYYYIVSYLFPATGNLAVTPASVAIDEIRTLGSSGRSEQDPAKDTSIVSRIDVSALTLSPVVDTVYGVAAWKVKLANEIGALAEQTGEGTPPGQIVVPLKTDDLTRLSAGGDIKVTMDIQDRKGQSIVLTATPVKINHFRTTGSLTVSPASVAIDEIENLDSAAAPGKSTPAVSRIDTSALTLHPVVNAPHGVARWKVKLANEIGALAEQTGEGTPPGQIVVPLKTDDIARLSAGEDIEVTMEIQDLKGHNMIVGAPAVKVNHFRTTGSLTVAPSGLTIEEIKTIDASPMLGHIYFAKGESDLPAQYVRLASGETEQFDEQGFRDTLEKYYQVLNIIGKRMTDHPEAAITLTGCNDNTGIEKGNRKLSTRRTETVRDYLQTVWGIAPERIRAEVRNLPKMPSTSRLEEGQADNRRVEITSDNPAILDLIRSTYFTTMIDSNTLTLQPAITAPHGVAGWTVAVSNAEQKLGELAGEGVPPADIKIALNTGNLNEMASGGDISVRMEVQDRKGQKLEVTRPVNVNFVQTSQLMAEKQEFRVQEKYALILFDFDSDVIDSRNQEIVNAIVGRIKELPNAIVDIVGHTDNVGKEEYNMKLSKRRALAVYKLLTQVYGEDPGERLLHNGVGPDNPLYDNTTSEARAFNRTVTITLEYMAGN